ncbi:MAG: tetratricopeptide repeat protein [Dongiaceae bacterium]
MPDLGVLSVPLLGAAAVFVLALMGGDDIAIDNIRVMTSLDQPSHTELVLTRELKDELRALNESAEAELTGLDVGDAATDKSLTEFEEYFNLATLVGNARNLAGITAYYVTGELQSRGEGVVLDVRVYSRDRDAPVSVISVKGDPKDLRPMLKEAALRILGRIDPYAVALHYYHEELGAGDLGFGKTRAMIGDTLTKSPRWRGYLAYNLIGRMHAKKAELDTALAPEQRQAELDLAVDYLDAALVQAPGFFGAHLNLAIVQTQRHQYELADRSFAAAVTIDPNNATARRRWAESLDEQGRLREAIMQYVAAVELDPDNAALRDRLAQLYLKAGRPDLAGPQWQRALVIDPMHKAFAERLKLLAGGDEGTATAVPVKLEAPGAR